MYNQEIYKFYYKIIEQAENNLNEFYRTQTNTLACLKGFFGEIKENNVEDLNKNALKSIDQGESMKFQGKTIFKNKKCKTWYTRYYDDGKQVYISGKTQKEVLAKLKSKLNYIQKEKQNVITLNTWYNKWLQLFKVGKVKESTIQVYVSLLKKIPQSTLNKNIKEITSIEIQDIINNTQGERAKQKLYEFLRDMFTKAEKHEICKNIMNKLDKPKHTRENGIALTKEDKEIFINYCKANNYPVFLVALYQGLRKGEVLGLTKEDVDFNKNTLKINKSWNTNNKFDTTKNEGSNRTMPLFEPTKQLLQNYSSDNIRLFEFGHRTLQKMFRKAIEETKLNSKYTIHSLRHTFITNCSDTGIPEHIIQSWVGHTIGSNVTKSVYTHIQEDSNLLNINKLNNSKFYLNSTYE